MKVFYDTNVILDFLGQREPYYNNSRAVILLSAEEKLNGITGAGAVTDIYYIIKRNIKNEKQTLKSVTDLLNILTLVDTKAQDIQTALSLNMADFEDAVAAATALREKVDYIITRNLKDFAKSPVPAIAPADFLKKFKLT